MAFTEQLEAQLKQLCEGESAAAHRFRYGLLAFDVITILFLIVSSFMHSKGTEYLDAAIGLIILSDVTARIWVSNDRLKTLLHPLGLVDVIVVLSLLAPIVGEGFAFLRVGRMLRLLRSYQLLHRLRHDFGWFRRNEQGCYLPSTLASSSLL